MPRFSLIITLLLLSLSGFSQIISGEQQHTAIDSTIKKKRNLAVDPDDQLPRIVVASRIGVWAPMFKFEERIGSSFSAGFNLGGRFIYYKGGSIEPFGRYYFKHRSPKGLFVQVKGIVGIYHTGILDNRFVQSIAGSPPPHGRGPGGRTRPLPSTLLETFGGGATVGYQWILGPRRHCALEVFGGFQYAYSTLDISYKYLIQKLALQNPLDIGIKIGGAF